MIIVRCMKQAITFLCGVCCLVLLVCSCNDEDGIMSLSDDGLTFGSWIGGGIPIALVSVSDLPERLRHDIEYGMEKRQMFLVSYKIFQGKWRDEVVYYVNNVASSCIGCLFYHHDSTPFGDAEWGEKGLSTDEFSDWRCIWSAAPLKKGITGILHYDPTENRDSYVDCGQERYYIWGGMNDSDLQGYDGKRVIMSGFLWGSINSFMMEQPSGVYPIGVACYGIEVTYLRGYFS